MTHQLNHNHMTTNTYANDDEHSNNNKNTRSPTLASGEAGIPRAICPSPWYFFAHLHSFTNLRFHSSDLKRRTTGMVITAPKSATGTSHPTYHNGADYNATQRNWQPRQREGEGLWLRRQPPSLRYIFYSFVFNDSTHYQLQGGRRQVGSHTTPRGGTVGWESHGSEDDVRVCLFSLFPFCILLNLFILQP